LVQHWHAPAGWLDAWGALAQVSVQVLKDTFSGGAQEIEDLWLPFFCVSTNLSKAQVEVCSRLDRLRAAVPLVKWAKL
jgi:predicted acylesterase/phospholipase RssA